MHRAALQGGAFVFLAGVLAVFFIDLVAPFYWGHDMDAHQRWQVALAEQLLQGELYPRWLAGLNEGFGSPAFFVYPPWSHAAALLFHPIVGGDAALRVQLSMGLAVAASGVAMFAWLRSFTARHAAIGGALLYMLAPYHVYLDVYRRAAMAETWAFVWPPLVLLALASARAQPRASALFASLAFAGLFLTHPPTTVVFVPCILLLAPFTQAGWRAAAVAIAGALGGAALAAIYLLPALTHGPFTQMSLMYSDLLSFRRWLLFEDSMYGCRPEDHIHACQLTAVVALQFALGALLFALALMRGPAGRRALTWVGLSMLLGVGFFMSAPSRVLWEHLPLLEKIQFPWRMLAAQTLALGLLAAIALEAPGRAQALARIAVLIGCTAFVGLAIGDRLAGSFGDINEKRRPFDTVEVQEYQPGDLAALRRRFADDAKWSLVEGDARVSVKSWRPREIVLDVDARSASRIAIRQGNDRGWEYEVGGVTRTTHALAPLEPVATFDVTAGRHEVALKLAPRAPERAGRWISLLAAAAWLVLFLTLRRARAERPAASAQQ